MAGKTICSVEVAATIATLPTTTAFSAPSTAAKPTAIVAPTAASPYAIDAPTAATPTAIVAPTAASRSTRFVGVSSNHLFF